MRYDPRQEPEGARRELLDRTPQGAAVLDVGCWSGFNGRYLTAHRGAVVDGVEPDVAMAQLAASDHRTVHPMGFDEALAGPLAQAAGTYDVLLFLDVLEHLPDPAASLSRALGLLAPEGRALVSLPNVAHWNVRWQLLRGRWEYTESGILDATHLRFFTFRSAEALARDAGWQVTWRSASLDRPPLIPLPPRHHRVLAPWPELFAAQILLELRPATPPAR